MKMFSSVANREAFIHTMDDGAFYHYRTIYISVATA